MKEAMAQAASAAGEIENSADEADVTWGRTPTLTKPDFLTTLAKKIDDDLMTPPEIGVQTAPRLTLG